MALMRAELDWYQRLEDECASRWSREMALLERERPAWPIRRMP